MYFHDICGAKLENIDELDECPECLCPLNKENISTIPDGGWIKAVSTDENFMKAMTELYENDPIEYQLKISQFKANLKQQENSKGLVKRRVFLFNNLLHTKKVYSKSYTPFGIIEDLPVRRRL